MRMTHWFVWNHKTDMARLVQSNAKPHIDQHESIVAQLDAERSGKDEITFSLHSTP